MADKAFVLSLVSLFIAGVSLLWNVLNATRIDRARIRADLSVDTKLVEPGAKPHAVVTVSATNVGKRAVVLTSLYLAYGRRWRWWGRFMPAFMRRDVFEFAIQIPGDDSYLNALSATLPVKLDVGDSATVFYDKATVLRNATDAGYERAWARATGTTARDASRPKRLSN